MKTLPKKKINPKADPREALIDAVIKLAAEGGIERISVRTVIAEAEGVSTDVYLYRLFGGKEKLLSDAFLREDKRLAEETERRSSVLWEENLPFESRMRYLWNTVWHYLTDRHERDCLFLTRYYYCSFCEEDTISSHRAIWEPLSEKWQAVFPGADTARLAEIFFTSILTAAFPVCQGRAKNDGITAENGFQTLNGIFSFWAENALRKQSVNA